MTIKEKKIMDIYSKHGTKVIFSYPKNGYESDLEIAKKYLCVEETYTVNYTIVHSYMTDVVLMEVPKIRFNSVQILKIQSLMTMVGGRVISLNDSLAEEWNTIGVGEQFNIDMERVEATIAAAAKAVPWVSGPVGAEDN